MPDESEVRAFQVDLREPGGASRGGPGKRAGMSTAEVRLALAECGRLPEGRPRAQRLESLAAEVRRTGDGPLEAEVLLALSRAYEYSAERERMAVPFARLRQLLDRFPAGLAAWLHFEAADVDDPDGEVLGVTTMRAVLAELESLPADSSSPELDTELTATRTQLGQMLAPPPADPRLTPAPSGEDEDGGETGLSGAA